MSIKNWWRRNRPWLGPFIGISLTIVVVIFAVFGVLVLIDQQSAADTPIAPPAWMEGITSACDPATGYRIWANHSVPFGVTYGGCS